MTFDEWWGENYIWWFKKNQWEKSLESKIYEAAKAAYKAGEEKR
jgi:hypothetical protein